MSRSLKIKREYLEKVKLSLRRNGYPSQRVLAEGAGYALATVSNFLRGKRVDYATFMELSEKLAFDWKDIADLTISVPKLNLNNLPQPSETSDFEPNRSARYPSGAVPLDSPFYLERNPIEQQLYQAIQKPGALVRIKAPREMGKTSLLIRVLNYSQKLGYCTISLNLEQAEQAILGDLNHFLRWLCANATQQLKLQPDLDEYWDKDLGSNTSCTSYFEHYLLEEIDKPIILAIDELNHIFEHPQIVKDFLPLLRSWYEEAKTNPAWQKLRLIVVHSTEIYVPLQLNQSPFNVGLPIQLSPFTEEEVKELAGRYKINCQNSTASQRLIEMIDGHPALTHIFLYHLSRKDITLTQVLEADTEAIKIFQNHLQRHWVTLKKQPELGIALNKVYGSPTPIEIDRILVYKLKSLGLIKQTEEGVIPSCELYRKYFTNQPKSSPGEKASRKRGVILMETGMKKLEEAKKKVEWEEKSGKSFTAEELSSRTGLSTDTLAKIFARQVRVDQKSLKACFQAFNLKLESNDYYQPE